VPNEPTIEPYSCTARRVCIRAAYHPAIHTQADVQQTLFMEDNTIQDNIPDVA